MTSRLDHTLQLAERVNRFFQRHGKRTALIGGAALAIHGHVRATDDVDLAIVTGQLQMFATELQVAAPDLVVTHTPADEDDPLGGLLEIVALDCDPLEVVNFGKTHGGPGEKVALAAVATASPLIEGSELPVADLAHLVALKLYAHGKRDRLDVLALLEGRDAVTMAEVRTVCERFGMSARLERLLADD